MDPNLFALNFTVRALSKVGAMTYLLRRNDINSLTAELVKVPQMAESISEGTLKSWSKQVGDSVEADEEVATIETDKVNTPLGTSSCLEK